MDQVSEKSVRDRILAGEEFTCENNKEFHKVAKNLQDREGYGFLCFQRYTREWIGFRMSFDSYGPYRIANPVKKEPHPPIREEQKTLGEILYDAFEDRLSGCDEWSKTSQKFKAEYEDAADAVRDEALRRAQIDQFLFEEKFHGAMELAKTHMQHASDYAKERDAYRDSYEVCCEICDGLLAENSKLKEQLKAAQSPRETVEELNEKRSGELNSSSPAEKKTSQRGSLYVLIVRSEGADKYSVRDFMPHTVTHSQMSAIVNILSEQLADAIDNLAKFEEKKKEPTSGN